ncbi:hypothetical protein Leryth_024160 [Lithospermum erythrorhizon]|uniref:Transmembrane protein n=1 Tax=Lithospermum erythrorhizon TaxID=34254 RepID=A0AAV3NUM1_LITER|nr:hypothetical protein Leryth_024160 [Lithospermum erythrorhizon]
MYRSASTTRVQDDHVSYYQSPNLSNSLRALSLETNVLPTYEPLSDIAKKERARAKLAENAIHIIPFVLLFCALLLWLLSNPDIGSPLDTKVEGLTLEGEVDNEGTRTENLPLQMGDVEFGHEGNRIGLVSDNRNK